MNKKIRIVAVLLATALISMTACGNSEDNSKTTETESDAVATTENGVVIGDCVVDYDSAEVPDGAAEVIEKYFKSIEEQNLDNYKATLFPAFSEAMESYLEENYGYGHETVLTEMYNAVAYYAGIEQETDSSGEVVSNADTFEITAIELSLTDDDTKTEHIDHYQEVLGDDMLDEINGTDEQYNIYFTLKGTVGESTEEYTFLEDNELLVVKDGDTYTIIA